MGESPTPRADLAVVIPTAGRDSLLRAVRSVYAQDFPGRIQILVGLDIDLTGRAGALRAALAAELPARMSLTWLDLGYSTSRRHGGVHSCHFGGALRTILTFCAQARTILYLDDDDWWAPFHVRLLAQAIAGRRWAFSLCWYADSDAATALAVDEIESVGPDRGIYKDRFGGFVRPSALALDKIDLAPILHLWSHSPLPGGDGEDRLIFDQLRRVPERGETGVASVYYAIDPRDAAHGMRLQYLAAKGVTAAPADKRDSLRDG